MIESCYLKYNLHFPRMSMEHNVTLMRYGEEFRYHRKIFQEMFRKDAVKNYHSVMLQKVHAMLYGLLKSPEKFEEHNKMYGTLNSSSSCLLIIVTQVICLNSNEDDVRIRCRIS
jgi:cytochrome P450